MSGIIDIDCYIRHQYRTKKKGNHYGVAKGPRREPKTNGAAALSLRARKYIIQRKSAAANRIIVISICTLYAPSERVSARIFFPVEEHRAIKGKASGREQPNTPPRQKRTTPTACLCFGWHCRSYSCRTVAPSRNQSQSTSPATCRLVMWSRILQVQSADI